MRRRVFLCAAIVVVVLPGSAHAAQRLGVVVAPGFDLSDVIRSRSFGRRPVAVGLLVPDAGPDTSEARARAALVRGEVENSLRGTPSSGPSVIQLGPRPQRIVVGIPSGGVQKNNRRYVVFMPADRYGLFTSESTRIPGLVSIADIAPTALREEGALGVQPSSDPLGQLRELDERIRDNGDSRMPGAAIAAGFVVLLALALPAAALLGLACALGANVVLGASGVSEPWVVWLVLGLATLVGGVALARTGRSRTAVGIVLVAVLAAYLVAMAIDQSWIALSPLGPTQNARFYGLSNLLETMLLVPALAGAALLARRFGPLAFLGTAALAVATIALSRFGADAGGALVLGAAYGALAVALTGARRRALAAGIAGAVALAGGVLFVDARRSFGRRRCGRRPVRSCRPCCALVGARDGGLGSGPHRRGGDRRARRPRRAPSPTPCRP